MNNNDPSRGPAGGSPQARRPRDHHRRARALTAALTLALSPCALAQVLPEDIRYAEDFEAGTGTMSLALADYTHGGYTPYSADAYWLDYANCNGVIVRYAADNGSSGFSGGHCSNPVGSWNDAVAGAASRNNVRRLADALGQVDAGLAGSTPATRRNHALTAWTTFRNGSDNLKQFETASMNLGAGMRFYTARVDVAEASCSWSRNVGTTSRLDLYLVSGNVEHAITDRPIEACADGRAADYSSPGQAANLDGGLEAGASGDGWEGGGATVRAGRFYSDAAMKMADASAVRVRLRNRTGSGDGNDAAIDNIVITDATPKLAKAFSPGSLPAGGGTARMVFTVNNRPDGLAKVGWRFTDTLQAGLTLAGTVAGGTCTNHDNTPGTRATLAGTVGGTSITVSGSLPGGASCTVEFDVEVAASVDAGTTLENCAADLSALEYIDGPDACAVLRITPAVDLSVTKTAGAASAAAGGRLDYTLVVRNEGPDAADGAVVRDVPGAGLDCTTASGATLACDGSGCPAGPLDPDALTGAGLTLPHFPGGGEARFTLSCRVDASGS
ncbi:DUF11 domain-containing protein [Stenotrophomonas mori]|uniref:DUF11 domain-containing protein n=1 Tax=Stenotrophomonas mori TaxID=2871096 RepID=A0ABT0SHS1_9GAMM|nr:DUF11 domain-containing protein [Stenotrophomonas mori]MCL7714882.1 DUF11 domain-containing protein [Stenotrophomonas mori]